MTFEQRVFSLFVSLLLIFVVLNLVRKGKLRAEYSWLWLLAGAVSFVLSLLPTILLDIGTFLGITNAHSILFLLAILFLITITLHFSIRSSELKNEVKNLAQKLALMTAKSENKSERDSSSDQE